MSGRHLAALIVAALIASGCVTRPPDKYEWGDYDPSLYDYYKSPAKVVELQSALEATLNAADTHHQPAAPGLRAEYGYLLLQQGKSAQAIAAFQAEEKQWPESTVFMEHMIKVASAENSASPPKGQGQ